MSVVQDLENVCLIDNKEHSICKTDSFCDGKISNILTTMVVRHMNVIGIRGLGWVGG